MAGGRKLRFLAAVCVAALALGAAEARAAKARIEKPDPALAAIKPLAGPVTIIVSISEQRLALYDGETLVDSSEVSTGVPGHPTPTGVFSILEKRRDHKSNIYSAAPMPYMQRLTWSGIALHEGHVPGRPASHGCIRLPRAFAQKLWRMTRLGARVIIADESIGLARFNHAALFRPAEPKAEHESAPAAPASAEPAAEAPQAAEAAEPFGPPMPTLAQWVQMRKRSGPISVYVSRKEGKLFVRQDLRPLFDVPVDLASREKPLGTHVFTAIDYASDRKSMRWMVATMPPSFAPKPPRAAKPAVDRKGAAPVIEMIGAPPVPTAAQALERFRPPQEAVAVIASLLTPGSTLILSDMGLGGETGKGTDFIAVRY